MVETLNCFVSGFSQLFQGNAFGLMLIGIGIGFVVGILPGIGGATSLVIMLPFVIKMKSVEAFAFLLGMAAVVGTTGDITSILFGIPGESSSAALIVDGHPMAKKGEAGRALGANLMSSLMGAIFGAFALAVAIPIVSPLVLAFRSPEFLMITILGLTFVASLSGGDLLKGLIAAGIGLFLATVGLAPGSGMARFTFDQLFLWDGIGLVPITIGFFAIPEIVDLAIQGTSIAGERVGKLGGVMEGVRDSFRHWWLVVRCAAIGTFAGVLPGIGGTTTQWLAYAYAVQSSKEKDRFGKGAIEGVLGPGAANNSTLGGHLVTTVAFGMPITVAMAILLGAFLIQGLVPGPDMLIPEPEGHLALTFSFVWTIVVSNIITVMICFLFLKQLIGITYIRGSLMLPIIIMLIYLGTFAEKNSFEDLILMLFFGAVGWVMVQLKWPRPPLILGLVLGPLTEQRLFISVSRYGLAWLLRPIVLVMMGLTVAFICYHIRRASRERRQSRESHSVPEPMGGDWSRWKSFGWSTVFELAIVVMFAFGLWKSMDFPFNTGLFPSTIAISGLALTIAKLIIDVIGKGGNRTEDHQAEAKSVLPPGVINRRTAGIFGWIIGFLAGIWLFGFTFGMPLCMFLMLKIGYRERWPFTLIVTASAWAFVYGLFDRVLHTPFPTGQLFLWF